MRIFQTEKQRENMAKFFWDMAKVALTFFVITPFAQPQTYGLARVFAGVVIGFTLIVIGYMLDGRKVAEEEK